jgi:DNA-binding beta-propeller fold protein YncE
MRGTPGEWGEQWRDRRSGRLAGRSGRIDGCSGWVDGCSGRLAGRCMRRLTLASLASLCALAGGLLLCSAPALAARGHLFDKSFGQAGSGNGEFEHPVAAAVGEATGDVYVADSEQNRVERFSATGQYLGYFNGSGEYEVEGKLETGTAAGFGGKENEVETGQFELGEYGEAGGSVIAVDNSCEQQRPALTGAACQKFDPSDGDVYVVCTEQHVVDKFGPDGEYIGQITGAGEGPFGSSSKKPEEFLIGLAVAKTGEVWLLGTQLIDSRKTVHLNLFTNAEQNTSEAHKSLALAAGEINISPSERSGFAVNPVGDFYLEEYRGYIIELGPKGELLNKQVDPEDALGVATESSTGDVYLDNFTHVTRVSPAGAQLEALGGEQLTDASGEGIAVDAASETVYVVDEAADEIDAYTPEPEGPPTVSGESVSAVTASSATLGAELDPRGPSTAYRFEYGPCATLALDSCVTSPYPDSLPSTAQPIGAGFEPIDLAQHLQNLQPHTAYHFRVFATNAKGQASANEVTFTTQRVGGSSNQAFALPDNRQWELVSPPNLHGAFMEPLGEGVVQAAADGEAFADFAPVPNEAQPLPAGTANGAEVISGRGAHGWSSRDVAAPGNGWDEFGYFSEDLSRAIVQPNANIETLGGFHPLSPAASEQTAYLHTDFPAGEPGNLCEEATDHGACFTPLVSATNVPAGTRFGEINQAGECQPEESPYFYPGGHERALAPLRPAICGPRILGTAPDAQHLVLEAGAQLTATSTEGRPGLYEWGGGALELVSLLPAGETNEAGGAIAEEPVLGQEDRDVRGTVSDDGSHVVFESPYGSAHVHLYVRVRAGEGGHPETVRIDLPQQGGSEVSLQPEYETASADGSRIFFIDTAGLTAQSSASGRDLYEYNLNAPAGSRLEDLSADTNGTEAADVANVIGASEDGSYVYFVAAGALSAGAAPGECGGAGSGLTDTSLCNLYVSHDGGRPALVAALSQQDYSDWGGAGTDRAELQYMTARVSPNGRFLAFMSQRSLTGYDNDDALSGQPDQEVYLYDATRPGSEGIAGVPDNPLCASCDPTGARPLGEEGASGAGLHGADGVGRQEHLAALLPTWGAWNAIQNGAATHQPRYLSNSGRLFFDTPQALAPQDVNGTWDVYEYEPLGYVNAEGTPECTPESAGYSESATGCQSLISSGQSSEPSVFLDASETGGDVFFLTSEQLVPEDLNTAPHVYDARECTAASNCFPAPVAAPPPCESGEACMGASNPQPAVFGAPASATFSGAGNPAPAVAAGHGPTPKQVAKTVHCRRGFVKNRKHECVRAKRRKTRKPSRERRTRR